jgi:hypothetical protein
MIAGSNPPLASASGVAGSAAVAGSYYANESVKTAAENGGRVAFGTRGLATEIDFVKKK